jgi:hypothetical protein
LWVPGGDTRALFSSVRLVLSCELVFFREFVEAREHGVEDGFSMQWSKNLQAKFIGELSETIGDTAQVLMCDPSGKLASLAVSFTQAGIGVGAAPRLTLASKLRTW